MRLHISVFWLAVAPTILTSCGSPSSTGESAPAPPPVSVSDTTNLAATDTASFPEQMEAIAEAVATWRSAETIEDAHAAAEMAANLVVGSNGPDYGDRNGDGQISGETAYGVLPGLDGTPAGLATQLATNDCIVRDVLGGPWTDPGAEWGAMLTAIDNWRPNNNTMPSLASHPMRIVGWASFTLESESLDEAHEYAGHANLHVNVALRALDC